MSSTVSSFCSLKSVSSLEPNFDPTEKCWVCQASYEEMSRESSSLLLSGCGKYLHYDCIRQCFEQAPGSDHFCSHCKLKLPKKYKFKPVSNPLPEQSSQSQDYRKLAVLAHLGITFSIFVLQKYSLLNFK